jgi:type II restriction/modification system DNA methylase subunit YeeA
MIVHKNVARVGLLATQAIRGGANRKVLERIKLSGDIFWAWSDRDWVLGGAIVHVAMVGFDDGTEKNRLLNGTSVEKINSDLSRSSDLTQASQLIENSNLSFIGTQRTGPFDIDNSTAQEFLGQPRNPNGSLNSDVIKPWINALDITGQPRKKWIIYFKHNTDMEEAAYYEMPFEYIRKHVKPIREGSTQKVLREKWWLFEKPRPAMMSAIGGLERFIVTPMVSKHRIFVWVSVGTIPENLTIVIARKDDYFFGILHSRLHETWARALGTQLREAESGTRYTPTSTFETFPFPWPPNCEPKDDPRVEAIAAAAKALVTMRDNWLNAEGLPEADRKKRTLTNLYNIRPTWLDLAHKKLDEVVFAAYGWPAHLSDEQILERLLALNLERAKR